ncbi:MAG TPA: PspC domain-containing protein [Mycobacteriales bacterium]
MTTTETGSTAKQPPAASQPRVLRRSRTDRVGVGVAGGLGRYFNVDPVLFRVLFAVSMFFGGAGILAYVIAWAAIPEDGTVNPPLDRFIAELRRRHIPIWLFAIAVGIALWVLAFSWWIPRRFFPVLIVVIALVVVFGRHGRPRTDGMIDAVESPDALRVTEAPTATPAATARSDAEPGSPEWVTSSRAWFSEARQASRLRRQRAFPVRISVLVTLASTLIVLGIVDAISGIRLPVYFWATAGIVGFGLLTGVALRRTPWSMATLLVPALAGMLAFGTTGASLHDGVGVTDWTPTSATALRSDYRLAFGQATLDLRSINTAPGPRDINITMAAGQIQILLPAALNATVLANVRSGVISQDGRQPDNTQNGTRSVGGYDIEHTITPPVTATGAPITITVHLADGNIAIHYEQ